MRSPRVHYSSVAMNSKEMRVARGCCVALGLRRENPVSQPGLLLLQLPGGYLYDTWKFVP